MNGADYAAAFVQEQAVRPDAGSDVLWLPQWRIDDWRKVLAGTLVKPFRPSDVLIQRDVSDRALYFVVSGLLEVGVTTIDGLSVSPLARIGAQSIIGEQSFFDDLPRSANVWAITEGVALRWEFEAAVRFGAAEPVLARDLLFAVARVLSTRLRMTSNRIRR